MGAPNLDPSTDLAPHIAALEAAGFRLLRPFKAREIFGEIDPSRRHVLTVIDFESTGKNASEALPIEIGAVSVEFDPATGALGRVTGRYSALEDPGFDLDPEVEKVTGLTRGDLIGHRFDDEVVNAMIASTDLFIAHKAEFDRVLGERRFPQLADKRWACSLEEVAWADLDIRTRSLEFLGMRVGSFHFDGHRALNDCEALLDVLSQPVGAQQESALHLALASADRQTYTVWATRSPFESKTALSEAGYRWSGDDAAKIQKTWHKSGVVDLQPELDFLREKVYGFNAAIVVDTITAAQRHSGRYAERAAVNLDDPVASAGAAQDDHAPGAKVSDPARAPRAAAAPATQSESDDPASGPAARPAPAGGRRLVFRR